MYTEFCFQTSWKKTTRKTEKEMRVKMINARVYKEECKWLRVV